MGSWPAGLLGKARLPFRSGSPRGEAREPDELPLVEALHAVKNATESGEDRQFFIRMLADASPYAGGRSARLRRRHERQEIHGHHRRIECNRHARFAGPGREAYPRPYRRRTEHALQGQFVDEFNSPPAARATRPTTGKPVRAGFTKKSSTRTMHNLRSGP